MRHNFLRLSFHTYSYLKMPKKKILPLKFEYNFTISTNFHLNIQNTKNHKSSKVVDITPKTHDHSGKQNSKYRHH